MTVGRWPHRRSISWKNFRVQTLVFPCSSCLEEHEFSSIECKILELMEIINIYRNCRILKIYTYLEGITVKII